MKSDRRSGKTHSAPNRADSSTERFVASLRVNQAINRTTPLRTAGNRSHGVKFDESKTPGSPRRALARRSPHGLRAAGAPWHSTLIDFLNSVARSSMKRAARGTSCLIAAMMWQPVGPGSEHALGATPFFSSSRRPEGDDATLDASGIADLISRTEGSPIDLSMLGYFHSLFPRVNPPTSALFEHRNEFVERIDEIAKAYPRWKDRWGEPDTWTRGQFLAILLMARFPDWNLDDLWCDEEAPAAFAAHAVGLYCKPEIKASDLKLVSEVVWESARHPRSNEAVAWLAVRTIDLQAFREEIAALLVLRDLSPSPVSPHLATLLRVKLPLTSFDPEPLTDTLNGVTKALKESGRWTDVRLRADSFLTLGRLAKVADLLPSDPDTLTKLVESDTAPQSVCSYLIRQALLDRFNGDSDGWPSWAIKLDRHPSVNRFRRGEISEPHERSCVAQRVATALLAQVEEALADEIPNFSSAEGLLDWYVVDHRHVLEYRVAEAFALLESVDDSSLHEAAHAFVMRAPNGLRQRVRHYTDQLDHLLADFIRPDPHAFQTGKRSACESFTTY